jgi:glycosyltransferase involved in cell wall biosynthesis
LRRKVALRAGVLLGHARSDTVIGFLEQAGRQVISGWAYSPLDPNMPVNLEILNRGALLARTVANMPRPDVKLAGFGHGRCGFSITLPAPLPALGRHEISVRPVGSTSCLIGSPAIIDPGIAHDLLRTGSLQTLIDAAVKGLGKASDIELFGSSLEAAGKMIKMQAADGDAAPEPNPAPARPVLLMLDENWPTAGLDAGSNAVMSHALALRELGYRVAFCATSGPPRSGAAHAGLSALQAAGIECHGHDAKTAEAAIRLNAERGLALVYLHRLATATAYGGLVRHYAPAAKVIYAVADLHHLRLARQAEVTGRPDLALRAGSVKAAEFWAMQMADCVLTHSSFEAAYLREAAPRMNVHVVPWAITATPKHAGRNRSNIAFIGGAGHAPNLDAVTHLARDIMPLVWQRDPTIKCYVAGPGWPENLFRKFDLRIVNRGYLPDLTALLQEVKLTVAPLRFGAGIKGKVLQSMAAGTACVMSGMAAEGLPLDDQLRAITGDGAAFAENILKIYHNRRTNRLAVQAGLDMIETRFSQSAVVAALARAIGRQGEAAEGWQPVRMAVRIDEPPARS